MIIQRLKELKAKSKLSNQQIADLSGVPYSTVCRIMSGDQSFPQAQNLADIIQAMGGSLDEFFGFPPKIVPAEEVQTPQTDLINLYQKMIDEKNVQIKDKDEDLKYLKHRLSEKRREVKYLALFSGISLVSTVALLIIGIFFGNF